MTDGARPVALNWPAILLAALVSVQIGLIGFLGWLFVDPAFHERMELDARPLLKTESVVVRREGIVDNVHELSGAEGLDPEAERHPLRRQLVPDQGHFSWIVLQDRAVDDDALLRLLDGTSGSAKERKRNAAELSDGVLNMFYDLGGREDLFVQNWSAVGARELQLSPLLSWMKHVDFAVLSCYLPDHCTGLGYIARVNPRLPVLAPMPHPDEGGMADVVRGMARVVKLSPGYHRLTRRLAALVYETDPLDLSRYVGVTDDKVGRRSTRHYALALILSGRDGRVLVNGVDGLPPDRLIPLAEEACGERVAAYVGATGWRLGSEDASLLARLQRLRARRPDLRIAAGYATSPVAQAMLRRVFGDGVRPALQGSRIPF